MLKLYFNFQNVLIFLLLVSTSSKLFGGVANVYETYYIQVSLEDNLVIKDSGEILKFKDDQLQIPINLISELVGIYLFEKIDETHFTYKLNNELITVSCMDAGAICIKDEIFLDINKWQSIFHIKLKFDEKKMQIDIYPEVEIPYLNKYVEIEASNSFSESEVKVEDVFTKKFNDGLAIDQNINYLGTGNSNVDTKISGNIYNFDSKITFNNQDEQSINLIKKRSNEFNFLGIKATEVQLLNVDNAPGSNLFVPQKLTGIYLNNYKQISGQFLNEAILYKRDKNWQGEIFRDGLLIEKVVANSDGNILFKNVTNKIGRNNYVIRLYGPQGQFEELSEVYNLRDRYNQGAKLNYQIFLGENNSKGINVLRLEQLFGPKYILGGTFLGKNNSNSKVYAFSIDHSLLFNKLNIDLVSSFQTGGHSLVQSEFNAITLVGDLVFKYERNNSYVKIDQIQNVNRKNKYEANLYLNSIFDIKNRLLFYDFGNSKRDSYLSLLSNYNVYKINSSTEIFHMLGDGSDYLHQTFRYFLKNSFFQSELKFNNKLSLSNLFNQFNIDLNNILNLYLNASYSVFEKSTIFNLGINYLFDYFKLNLSSSIVDNKISFSSSVFYSLLLSRDKSNLFSSKPIENNSVVKIVSYEDTNYNNSYDAGELLIKNIRFKINEVKYLSNHFGEVFIDSLPSYSHLSVSPELNSVEDIYLYPSFTSKKIFLRPTMINTIYFPFSRFYSISLKRFQNKKFKLVNELNVLVTSGKIDGNDYVLEKIKPGNYLMYIGEDDSYQVFKFNVVDQDIDLFP